MSNEVRSAVALSVVAVVSEQCLQPVGLAFAFVLRAIPWSTRSRLPCDRLRPWPRERSSPGLETAARIGDILICLAFGLGWMFAEERAMRPHDSHRCLWEQTHGRRGFAD